MINLDARYQSYMNGSKKLRIDGVDEAIRSYGYTDDGSSITGYYLITTNYKLYYNNDAVFLSMEALAGLKEKAPV
jgi:hypothetical protein